MPHCGQAIYASADTALSMGHEYRYIRWSEVDAATIQSGWITVWANDGMPCPGVLASSLAFCSKERGTKR